MIHTAGIDSAPRSSEQPAHKAAIAAVAVAYSCVRPRHYRSPPRFQLPPRHGGAMIRRYYVGGQPGADVDGVTTRFSKMSFDDAAA